MEYPFFFFDKRTQPTHVQAQSQMRQGEGEGGLYGRSRGFG